MRVRDFRPWDPEYDPSRPWSRAPAQQRAFRADADAAALVPGRGGLEPATGEVLARLCDSRLLMALFYARGKDHARERSRICPRLAFLRMKLVGRQIGFSAPECVSTEALAMERLGGHAEQAPEPAAWIGGGDSCAAGEGKGAAEGGFVSPASRGELRRYAQDPERHIRALGVRRLARHGDDGTRRATEAEPTEMLAHPGVGRAA